MLKDAKFMLQCGNFVLKDAEMLIKYGRFVLLCPGMLIKFGTLKHKFGIFDKEDNTTQVY